MWLHVKPDVPLKLRHLPIWHRSHLMSSLVMDGKHLMRPFWNLCLAVTMKIFLYFLPTFIERRIASIQSSVNSTIFSARHKPSINGTKILYVRVCVCVRMNDRVNKRASVFVERTSLAHVFTTPHLRVSGSAYINDHSLCNTKLNELLMSRKLRVKD